MVDQAVDSRDGHRRILEDLVPFSEWLVCGDHQRTAFVSGGNQLEQYAGFGLILCNVCNVIENQQMKPIEFGDGRRQLQCLSLHLQALNEIGGAHEQHMVAVLDQGAAECR